MIQLRSVDRDRGLLKEKLQNLIVEFEQKAKKEKIKVYSRIWIDTDFGIQLFHESETVESGGSHIGVRLATALKEFGMVHHSVWVEM